MVVIDEKGVAIEVNKELCNMTGYDKSEVIGKHALEFI
ncbi:PAS domain S-box protein [Peptoclostridium litorale]